MKNRIEEAICKDGRTVIPKNIKVLEEKGAVRIVLNGKRIQEINMQDDGNAFEGWVIAAHVCTNGSVVLDIDEKSKFQYKGYIGNGHLCRFLYRAMKFRQQYSKWFGLSPYLDSEVTKFEKYLYKGKFVNNVGTGDAGYKGRYDDENAVEAKLAEKGVLRGVVKSIDIGNGNVHRQLPVGLFIDKVSKSTPVFTRGKSAIDLWTLNNDVMNVVELKTKNTMIGIITEIFFYSNYVYDLVRDDGLFQLSAVPKGKKTHRGYEEIVNGKIKRINGIMLYDDNNFHPWVNKESLRVLNMNNNKNLKYYYDSYHLEIIVK